MDYTLGLIPRLDGGISYQTSSSVEWHDVHFHLKGIDDKTYAPMPTFIFPDMFWEDREGIRFRDELGVLFKAMATSFLVILLIASVISAISAFYFESNSVWFVVIPVLLAAYGSIKAILYRSYNKKALRNNYDYLEVFYSATKQSSLRQNGDRACHFIRGDDMWRWVYFYYRKGLIPGGQCVNVVTQRWRIQKILLSGVIHKVKGITDGKSEKWRGFDSDYIDEGNFRNYKGKKSYGFADEMRDLIDRQGYVAFTSEESLIAAMYPSDYAHAKERGEIDLLLKLRRNSALKIGRDRFLALRRMYELGISVNPAQLDFVKNK